MSTSWVSPFFTHEEMACHCGCVGSTEKSFMNLLTAIRREANFPFIITSGYRCPEYNSKVSESGLNGPHTYGLAADIRIYGGRAYTLIRLALKWGMTGIGVSQKGPLNSRIIHLDSVPETNLDHPRPWVWSY